MSDKWVARERVSAANAPGGLATLRKGVPMMQLDKGGLCENVILDIETCAALQQS